MTAEPDPPGPDPLGTGPLGAADGLDEPDRLAPDELDAPDGQCIRGRLVVAGFDAQTDHVVDLDALCQIAVDVLVGEGIGEGGIDIHLVDTITMIELNVEHMDVDGPTDVLAFPLESDPFTAPNGEPAMIGDVVLCPAVAVAQAADHAGTNEAEFALLVIHGVLHLLGNDHALPDETLVMQARERTYLERLGFDHPVPPARVDH